MPRRHVTRRSRSAPPPAGRQHARPAGRGSAARRTSTGSGGSRARSPGRRVVDGPSASRTMASWPQCTPMNTAISDRPTQPCRIERCGRSGATSPATTSGSTSSASATATSSPPSCAKMRCGFLPRLRNRKLAPSCPLPALARLMRSSAAQAIALRRARRGPPSARGDGADRRHRMARERCARCPIEEALAFMEQRAAAIRDGTRARVRLAARASAIVHRRHQRRPRRTVQPAGLSGLRGRARRALHLSRPRPAGRLCHARPRKARKGHPLLRPSPRSNG